MNDHESSTATHLNELNNREVFVRLVFGLNTYLKARDTSKPCIPNGLRLALNRLAFEAPHKTPRTIYRLIQVAHQPTSTWYSLAIPESFNASQPLLSNNHLSDEAQEFYLDWEELLHITPLSQGDIPQAVLDNVLMQELRDRLKNLPDAQQAQRIYEAIRLFLIQHSWVTPDDLRGQYEIWNDLKAFYEFMPPLSLPKLRVCNRCGLLLWKDNSWHGVKPTYCSDHADDSPSIDDIPNYRQMHRLKEGIHLRTFIPGRIELALFESAESMDANYPDSVAIERYPGIDTYDMRLLFRDGDVWAIDAKDQVYPKRLARTIRLPYGEGNLAYGHAFFVLPDERTREAGYVEQLERALGVLPKNLYVLSFSEFHLRFEAKMKLLTSSSRKKKKEQ